MRCDKCKWWVQGLSKLIGECRRMPPSFIDHIPDARVWPFTKREDWCGEYVPKEPKP
jgi:hypothetical protein